MLNIENIPKNEKKKIGILLLLLSSFFRMEIWIPILNFDLQI